jgi:predicted DNA-binding ribbon-helix-helix protein
MADISKDRLKAKIKELENIVESQHSYVAMLQNDLYNERLRNDNLSELALAIDKQKARKPEDN